MPTPTELRSDFVEVVNENGTDCTITSYGTITFGTGYDDEQLISASGATISGGIILLPIGESDRQYVEQGLADWNDSKAYLAGSIATRENMVLTIGNSGSLYEVLRNGIMRYDVSGTTIYQRLFLRKIASGQHPGVQ